MPCADDVWVAPCAIQARRTRYVSIWLAAPLFVLAWLVAVLTSHLTPHKLSSFQKVDAYGSRVQMVERGKADLAYLDPPH